MEQTVRQGFICPFCMTDLGDFPQLAAHVDSVHPEGEGDLDIADTVVQNVKGFFDKAKRGIKKIDARSVVDFSQVNTGVTSSVADIANIVTERVQDKTKPLRPQASVHRPVAKLRPEIGLSRSHKDYFIKCRDSSVNETAVLTNTLIIRLDRLINECPNDQTKRKEFERSIVPWTADSESPHCRCCAAKFGLTRRRHHCRLCGRVMCHNCSRHLSFLSARKLTNPAISIVQDDDNEERSSNSPSHGSKLLEVTHKTTEKMKSLFESTVSRMSGMSDGSEVSLGSLLQQDAEEYLRVCPSCLMHLHKREQMMEQSQAPAIVEQYVTLDKLITEVTALSPNYVRMATSLNNGETMYTLKAAEELKLNLLRKQKEIDVISKKMVTGFEEMELGPRETRLRTNIRSMAHQTLSGLIGYNISLPTKEQYDVLVEKHREEISRQIEETRKRAAEPRPLKTSTSMPSVTASTSRQESPKPNARQERKATEEGWTPQSVASYNPFMEEADRQHPLKEQRDIIRSYLSQAAAAGRTDEVDMLERNLRDLEEELRLAGIDPH